MAWRSTLLVAFAVLSTVVSQGIQAAVDESIEPRAFADRVLVTTDLVLDRHLDPPTRQSMILAVVKALANRVNQPIPAGLSRRISELAKPDEFTTLLQDVWAQANSSGKATSDQLQTAAFDGLRSVVPGNPRIIPMKELKVEERLAANRYVGIGIQLSLDEQTNLPVITVPFARGPAHLAGVKPDDRILQIDGAST